ncbi:glucokinase [Sphingomonas mesophila]|uniref:glucokinase n=1 Tax=Sphingomonas mesophila TaxID=2303576 RepID=UPI000E56D189|nr:glucokinase [Sphingomonas mesophila]
MTRTIAVADIGGTNARFALATIAGRDVLSVGEPVTLGTSDHPTFADAWTDFARRSPGAEPDALGLAFAGPVDGGDIKLTNNDWRIDRASLAELGIDHAVIVNDFEAVANAVATLDDEWFAPLAGPPGPLPRHGVTTILGPGTGLGVAIVAHGGDGAWQAIATEGGHIGFAPDDAVEDRLVQELRPQFGRVSAERVASGPALADLHRMLTGNEAEHRDLWQSVLAGENGAVAATFDRWCAILGSVAGDLALAQGASGVVLAGGLGYRLRDRLPNSAFAARFAAKPPYEQRMAAVPVRMLTQPQPGLFGAAVAFARSPYCGIGDPPDSNSIP